MIVYSKQNRLVTVMYIMANVVVFDEAITPMVLSTWPDKNVAGY